MFKTFFSRQARKPAGWFGRLVAARIFDKGNAPLNAAMLALVAARSGDRILEIGFGTGSAIRTMADALERGAGGGAQGGLVEGIDFSDAMLSVARRRNRAHIAAGRVRLVHGDFDAADYAPESFDTVCSANTIYFWPDRAATAARIHALLKPGGRLVLSFVGRSRMEAMPLDMAVFSPISAGEVAELFREAGFASATRHQVADGEAHLHCVEACKAGT